MATLKVSGTGNVSCESGHGYSGGIMVSLYAFTLKLLAYSRVPLAGITAKQNNKLHTTNKAAGLWDFFFIM